LSIEVKIRKWISNKRIKKIAWNWGLPHSPAAGVLIDFKGVTKGLVMEAEKTQKTKQGETA
jgi:hypothetical protein